MASKLLDFYLFETTERISRFVLHLDNIHKQFYSSEKSILKDKVSFISSYEDCLEKLVEMVLNIDSVCNKRSKKQVYKAISDLELVNLVINSLQKELLVHLPRPTEPVELRRFFRVVQKQILKLKVNSVGEISIYVNENAEDNSFATDPLENYKQEKINTLISSLNTRLRSSKEYVKINPIKSSKKVDSKKGIKNIHISIPRLEANNSCHWPTLLHEVAHNLMQPEWFNGVGIGEDFFNFLKASEAESSQDILSRIEIEAWLIECWCDLFACALIGPAFYFSQCSVFAHSLEYNENKLYPPNHFRLKLIAKFIEHRYKNLISDERIAALIDDCDKLVEFVDSKNNSLNFKSDTELAGLFSLFNHYFINEFFILREGVLNFKHIELSSLFKSIDAFVREFRVEKINSLTQSLNNGFPIPSFRKVQGENVLYEEANSVQEIFLASWIFRNDNFKNRILEGLRKICKDVKSDLNSRPDALKVFKTEIVKEFDRFDQSILRSIQVSEWVDLLFDDQTEDFKYKATVFKKDGSKAIKDGALLVDKDIFNRLLQDDIKIIPLININKQLGSTSLDIRLGSSFEVFYPNQFGIVDFTNVDAIQKVKNNSKNYNLDFLESIPINPGQFVLGHSMEYIKLPNNLSADLEGRSSFARLGIEIHMTAGFVDPGFEGVLTFEIFNAGTNPIMLYPGLRIGQLRFAMIKDPLVGYTQRHGAKYGGRLEHNFSLQGEDYEVKRISDASKKIK